MTITPGNYILRNGWKARVLCDDAPGHMPCVGYYLHPDANEALPESWTIDGRMFEDDLSIIHADYEPDWSEAPEWAMWYAVNQIGYAFWWRDQPKPSTHRWSGDGAIRSESVDSASVDMTNINWKETLRKRP